MVPCLVSAAATGTYYRIRIEASTCAALMRVTARFYFWLDEATFSTGQLSIFARGKLSRKLSAWLRVTEEHREWTRLDDDQLSMD